MTEATGIVGEFLSLKEETDAELLAMQCGDFYEFFGDDAETVAEELDLKVSQKSSHGSSYPMAGVPVDDLTPYLKALVERGYRVAVADQYETDSGHAREIVRVVTPGTVLERSGADARYLSAIVASSSSDAEYGLAFADVTTGRFLVADAADVDGALTELYRFAPVEVLPGPTVRNDDALVERVRDRTDATLTLHEAEAFAPRRADHAVGEQFGRETVDRLPVSDPAIAAAGAVLSYVEETGAGVLASMTRIRTHRGDDHVTLDATTQRNLELTETMHGDREGSLFATIDHAETSAGRRLSKEWLQRPRRSLSVLEERQESVAALTTAALARDEIRETLGSAYDLERLASRAAHGSADAGELLAVRDTLSVLPELAEAIGANPELAESPLTGIVDRPDREAARELREALAEALAEEPPSTVTRGGLLTRGYDDELDGVIERHEELKRWFDALADREKRQYGLSHVTVDRNKTDGYYVQVGKSAADEVPDHYEEIKTLKSSKRFTTPELEEKEREILRTEERRGDLEYELFCDLRDRVADRAELLQDVGRALATVDALASLATHAAENGWVRPDLHRGDGIDIDRGRHPIVEQTTEFVPNDLRMGGAGSGGTETVGAESDGTEPVGTESSGTATAGADGSREFLIVTGPNMSGKSTYMRQAALIVLLAQIGSFVPAREASIGLVDGIFTRVGALDELAQGRSTFMVEMSELSNILHSATEDSLVVLDEVGRGTATYDGISIAWAATEYLHNEVRAKTLFATHYHELTALADRLPRVENVHVAVAGDSESSAADESSSRSADRRDEDITFLRTVREGPTDRSYGIHVAELAGVPNPVVERSRDVLEKLRDDEAIDVRGGENDGGTRQVVFDLGSGSFRGSASADGGEAEPLDPATESVLEQLKDVDVNQVTPLELTTKVREWQRRLDE